MSLPLTTNTLAANQAVKLESRLTDLANGGPAAIEARLSELDAEWSAGRVAKAFLSICILLGTILTTTLNWWWVILPAIAGLLLFQYLFTQTSLLVWLVQRMGFRTRADIEREKFALRTLRGDFRTLPTLFDIENAEDISRLEGEGGIAVDDDERKVDSREAVKEVLEAVAPAATDQSGEQKS